MNENGSVAEISLALFSLIQSLRISIIVILPFIRVFLHLNVFEMGTSNLQ